MAFKKIEDELDHKLEPNAVCPYCGYIHEDSWDLSDDGETECDHCGKEFSFQRDVEITYCTSKIDSN